MSAIHTGFDCPDKIVCPGSDDPLANLSAEGYDYRRYLRRAYGPRWNGECCTLVCESFVSQQDADLCAQRKAVILGMGLCSPQLMPDGTIDCVTTEPPPGIFCNTEQEGECFCEDGSPFTATVAACSVYANSQEEANAIALSLANQKARAARFCCPPGTICCCVGDSFQREIEIDGGTGPFNWVNDSGTFPAGVVLNNDSADKRRMLLQGTPTVAGVNTVTYLIYDAAGNFLTKTFTVYAIEIATTSLPDFTVGQAYSCQLQAVGGSGSYAWSIASGTLPAGLTMSLAELISGTPTAATTASLTFNVIDTACQSADRTFFPPRIALTGTNTTTIATIKGFAPYSQTTTPPKKYKKLEWTGTSEQWAVTFAGSLPCSGAKYVWSGASEIDVNGNYISKYRKDYYAQCPADTTLPTINTIPGFGLTHLEGYCWPADPGSCPTCPPSPYTFVEDRASNSINDITTFLNDALAPTHTLTDLSLSNVSSSMVVGFIGGAVGFPVPPQIILRSSHNYSSQLSIEYTDADALASATHWTGNGLVAETRPRTTGFTSTWTSVVFRLACSNLVPGESYRVTVDFVNSHYVHTQRVYTFTTATDTYLITDNVPTPAAGDTLEVRDPHIQFI